MSMAELYVLDTSLAPQHVLDDYQSYIWTDRYDQCGDFEIYLPATAEIVSRFPIGNYIRNTDSDRLMIIETIRTETNVESGNYVTVTGRSFESVLDRRIVWNTTVIDGNLQNAVQKLLNENAISPVIGARAIPNLIFEASTDSRITSLTWSATYDGDNLYNVICEMCQTNKIGFKITLRDDGKFVFKLYAGVDRSYSQTSNLYVVFSPSFDNLVSSDRTKTLVSGKNVCLVLGAYRVTDEETEETTDYYINTVVGSASGLNRREAYSDLGSFPDEDDDGNPLTDSTRYSMMEDEGKTIIEESKDEEEFEASVDTQAMYIYNKDYFIGDICQVKDELGYEARVRITEYIYSDSTDGQQAYPTFETILEE